MSRWLDISVVPDFSWPNEQVEVPFHNTTIVLVPATDDLLCTASAYDPMGQIEYDSGVEVVRRFLSCFAWANKGGVREISTCGTNHPDRPSFQGTHTRERSFHQQKKPPDFLYVPQVREEKARLALAVYREAMGLNSEPFSFLGHFKILNILFNSGSGQKDWINRNIRFVKSYSGVKRLQELRDQADVGAYLYHQGRCSVAHAFDDNVVDPDAYQQTERLGADLQLMRELAEICIEREFGVLRPEKFWGLQRFANFPTRALLRNSGIANGRHVYTPVLCA